MTIQFLQARHFRRGPRQVDLVVIHSAEIGESLEGAEALMRVCATSERVASWHYAVDADSITQSVREEDIAFHAPGANRNGIGIELSGRARQTREEWLDAFSRRMLELAAELVAGICARHTIPLAFVTRDALLRGERGITTHHEVSQAWHKSTHWDPGPGFPMAFFLDLVDDRRQTDPAPPPSSSIAPDLPVLQQGASGLAVSEVQRILGCGVDGHFGPRTRAAVITFQRARMLKPDGIVGSLTWAELLKERGK